MLQELLELLEGRLPQIVVAAVFAVVSAIGTSVYKNFFVRRRLRHRIGREIAWIQTKLFDRASPDVWRAADQREPWMLEPFIRQIGLLTQMADQERLSEDIKTALDAYSEKAKAFIERWSSVKARHTWNFWSIYEQALEAAIAAQDSLGVRRKHQSSMDELSKKKKPVEPDED